MDNLDNLDDLEDLEGLDELDKLEGLEKSCRGQVEGARSMSGCRSPFKDA